jgi:hypothetical protein
MFIELLEENANDIYNNMKNNISKIKIREKLIFLYFIRYFSIYLVYFYKNDI